MSDHQLYLNVQHLQDAFSGYSITFSTLSVLISTNDENLTFTMLDFHFPLMYHFLYSMLSYCFEQNTFVCFVFLSRFPATA